MKRGEIRLYTFMEPDKHRPVLILTRDSIINYLNDITIAPVTTTIREIPSEVLLTQDDGMHITCVVNFDHIQTVSKGRIGKLITQLSPIRMEDVNKAIIFALDLQNTTF